MSYLDLPLPELVRQYSPRIAVPEHPVWKAHWTLASARARKERRGRMRIPYGPGPRQTLDIFPATVPGSPINVFVHGGFWRFLDSYDHSLVAPAVLDAGGASILINYDLCPTVPLIEVVRQVRSALAWVWKNAEEANGDREKIYVSGHSAGGHLAMMMCVEDCGLEVGYPNDAIKGATIVSAMLDLEPVLMVPGSEELSVALDEVRSVSPKYVPPAPHIPLIIAVGGRETDEWIRQTEDMLTVLKLRGSVIKYLKPEYDQHYSILLSLGNPMTDLCSAMLDQMGLG